MSAETLKALMLQEPRLTLAVAESLTAGHVQARVASVSGASGFFLGGTTAYSLEEKVKLLGVDRALAEKVNCVSREIAEQMASGVCRLFGASVGVATTGYAEPAPEQGVDVPHAWWAMAWVRGGEVKAVRAGRIELPGMSRVDAQRAVAERAVAELAEFIREIRAGVGT